MAEDPTVPFKPPRGAGRCPTCGKPTQANTRPFCSRRCADLDLGRWLDGSYRIERAADPESDDFDALERSSDQDQ